MKTPKQSFDGLNLAIKELNISILETIGLLNILKVSKKKHDNTHPFRKYF